MKHIISTLECATKYTGKERDVLVKGRSGGVVVRGHYRPTAVRTEVSDDDAEFLAGHGLFQLHQKNGFVKIEEIAT